MTKPAERPNMILRRVLYTIGNVALVVGGLAAFLWLAHFPIRWLDHWTTRHPGGALGTFVAIFGVAILAAVVLFVRDMWRVAGEIIAEQEADRV